jgi:hypothetical protein
VEKEGGGKTRAVGFGIFLLMGVFRERGRKREGDPWFRERQRKRRGFYFWQTRGRITGWRGQIPCATNF